MSKIDKVVLRETAYIAVWTLIFSVFMQAVFLMIGKWDLTVILGNLYGGVAAILNFFLMALSVQKAVDKDEKDAKQYMKASGSLRLLALFVVILIGVLLECFNIWTVVIPLLFPRVAISLRPFFGKRMGDTVSVESGEVERSDGEATVGDAAEVESENGGTEEGGSIDDK